MHGYPRQHQQEVTTVEVANTIEYPWAVMVELKDASLADRAMVGSSWFLAVTTPTDSNNLLKFNGGVQVAGSRVCCRRHQVVEEHVKAGPEIEGQQEHIHDDAAVYIVVVRSHDEQRVPQE